MYNKHLDSNIAGTYHNVEIGHWAEISFLLVVTEIMFAKINLEWDSHFSRVSMSSEKPDIFRHK